MTRKMDEFRAMDPSITRNLGEILLLTMNVLQGLHGRTKSLNYTDADRNMASGYHLGPEVLVAEFL